VATLLGSFEPLLILVMGGLGLLIVIAILLPTFDLNQLVK
jgi:general secretion pathway protein F